MDLHQLIDVGFAVMAFFGGWVLKRVYHSIDELWKKNDEIANRLTNLAIDLPSQYVTKKDLSHAIDIIHERFDKLDAKLDSIQSQIK
ncbi:uncharacterized protein METZ01_LOCUS92670 [marine metagenome]|uniref:Uncharacterized protein n=1 Tax=marine metagenome TaxID=408172 RepID=A0A381VHH4_9ZZZZ